MMGLIHESTLVTIVNNLSCPSPLGSARNSTRMVPKESETYADAKLAKVSAWEFWLLGTWVTLHLSKANIRSWTFCK